MTRHGEDSGRPRVAMAVDGAAESLRRRAELLSRELNLPFFAEVDASAVRPEFLLVVTKKGLELRDVDEPGTKPLFVDFVGGPVGFRRRSRPTRGEAIGRALGLRGGVATVVDATAGLGRDLFLLACLDCTVKAIERSAVLAALVRDGLDRAREHGSGEAATLDMELARVVDRITLVVGDARDVLRDMPGESAPDVVYLDPMYPPTSKTALPKKEMRICRRLVGDDADADTLLKIARETARKRVVVKRHPHASPLAPDHVSQHRGRKVRYDVYMPFPR